VRIPAGVPAAVVELVLPIALGVSLVLVTLRFLRPPTIFDRLAAMEAFSLTFLALVALLGVVFGSGWFMDFVLAYSLIGYVATVALAKYLAQGSIADD
jgi:multisubunit Na+/H+ antiporter MnhF subunit